MAVVGEFIRSNTETDLELSVTLAASPAAVWKAWSTPELLRRWWAPQPWETPFCEMDMRAGGAFRVVMRGPDGTECDGGGLFVDVQPGRRIVFTDALTPDFRPSEEPFFSAVVVIEPAGDAGAETTEGGTRYTARVLHKNAEDRERHEEMGFFDGWAACIAQLADVAAEIDARPRP